MSIDELSDRHCAAHKPKLTLAGFATHAYGTTADVVYRIATGQRRASDQFLLRLHRTHVRLFPGEIVDVALPDGRTVHLHPDRLTITFPANN